MALTEAQLKAIEEYNKSRTSSPKLGQTQDTRWEFTKGVSSGIDQLQGMGYGLAALAGDAIGSEGLREFGLEGYERNVQEAQENAPRIGRVEDVESFGDFTDLVSGTLGQLVPTAAAMATGGGLAGMAVKSAARNQITKLAGEALAKRVALAQTAGTFGASMGMATGGIYGDVASEGAEGAGAILPALAGGAASGALDALPILRLGKAFGFGGELKKKIVGKIGERIAKEGGKQAFIEGGTEALQSTIEEATKAFIMERGLPDDMGSILLNSVVAGAIGGSVMGGATGAIAGESPPPGPIEKAAQGLEKQVEEGKNPVSGEDFGFSDIAAASNQLQSIDQQIKANPNGPMASKLREKAGVVLDEIANKYILGETDAEGKRVEPIKVAKMEAEDLINFYRDYVGGGEIEIGGVAPETNEQREARLADEEAARVGKAEREQGTMAEGPQNIAEEEREAMNQQLNAEAAAQVEEEQILQAETEKLTNAIEERAEEIVNPTPEPEATPEPKPVPEVEPEDPIEPEEVAETVQDTSDEDVIRELPEFIPQEEAPEVAAEAEAQAEIATERREPEIEKAEAIAVEAKIAEQTEKDLAEKVAEDNQKLEESLQVVRNMASEGASIESLNKALDLISQKTGNPDARGMGEAIIIEEMKKRQENYNKWAEFYRLSEKPVDSFTGTPPVGYVFGSDYVPSKFWNARRVIKPDEYMDGVREDMEKNFGPDPFKKEASNLADKKAKTVQEPALSDSEAAEGGQVQETMEDRDAERARRLPELTVPQMRQLLKEANVPGRSKFKKKPDLVNAVLENINGLETTIDEMLSFKKGAKKPTAKATLKKQKEARDALEAKREREAALADDPLAQAAMEEGIDIPEVTRDGENIGKEELRKMEQEMLDLERGQDDLAGTGLEDFGSYDEDPFEFSVTEMGKGMEFTKAKNIAKGELRQVLESSEYNEHQKEVAERMIRYIDEKQMIPDYKLYIDMQSDAARDAMGLNAPSGSLPQLEGREVLLNDNPLFKYRLTGQWKKRAGRYVLQGIDQKTSQTVWTTAGSLGLNSEVDALIRRSEMKVIRDFEKSPARTAESFSRSILEQRLQFGVRGNYIPGDTEFAKRYEKRIKELEKDFYNWVSKLKIPSGEIKFVFIKDMSDAPDSLGRKATLPVELGYGGMHRSKPGAPTEIYMNPHNFVLYQDYKKEFLGTFLHELVGHHGLRRLFDSIGFNYANGGISKYDDFLDRIADTNREILEKALDLRFRWDKIDLKGGRLKGQKGSGIRPYTVVGQDGKTKETIYVSNEARRRLLDEYIAERAKEFSDPKLREKWTKGEESLMKRLRTWVKHRLRTIFGEHKITDEDLMAMVAQSYENLYGQGVALPNAKGKKKLMVKPRLETLAQMTEQDVGYDQFSPAESYNEAADNGDLPPRTKEEAYQERLEALKQAAAEGMSIKEITAADAVMNSGYADVTENAFTSYGIKVWRKFRNEFTPMYSFFNAEGTLRNHKMKEAVAQKVLGNIERTNVLARKAQKVLKNLSQQQKRVVMEFMRSDRINVEDINLTQSQKDALVSYKEEISKFGERLVRIGKLDPETYLANQGKYLPARYMLYASRAMGSGRKASPLTYLMKKAPELTARDKAMLGELQNPEFIIPEALSLIGRDVALLEYTHLIGKLSSEKDLGWVLGDNKIEQYNTGKKITIDRAETLVESYRKILEDVRRGDLTYEPEHVKALEEELAHTENELKKYNEALEAKIKSEVGLPLDQPFPADEFKKAVSHAYRKMPMERGYGDLAGRWVRKEIYDEFTETTFAIEDMNGLTKALAPGGKMDRANQLWKLSKVVLNPPSWFRNAIGNFVLLDIASPTNSLKLMKMWVEELVKVYKGKPSEYWAAAHEHGLFGTTYSSSEIYLLSEMTNATHAAKVAREMQNLEGSVKSQWLKIQGMMLATGEAAANFYGGLEGVSKAVAMRDYIERWTRENGVDSLKSLDQAQRDAVMNRSVIHANEAIFDYSNVTAWFKDLRRNAFGAPFITYTMKALPAVVRGLSRNPQKFIKYAALPSIMSAYAVSSLGDLTPEEIDEIEKNMPKWMREKSSVYLWPTKDANGKIVPVDFGYYFPWAPWQDVATKSIGKFQYAETGEDYAYGAVSAAWDGANSLGLLGGPIPTTIVSLLSNKDTFMGREIVSAGDSAGTALAKIWNYGYAMMAPPFLTNHGVAGKLMDHYDMSILGLPNNNVDIEGNQKETMSQSILRGLGVSSYATTVKQTKYRRAQEHKAELRKLQTARSKVVKNQGLSKQQKVREIQDINRRMILLNRKYSETTK